jgi:hypothetical protein
VIGGLYQNTHESRRLCEDKAEVCCPASEMELMDGLLVVVERMLSFADFSAEGVLAPTAPIACSNGFADVLGVLAEPNDANAPEPRPNWLAPPVLVGEAKAPGVVGAKALVRPCEEVPPFLRDRLEKSRGAVLSVGPAVPRERLLLLLLLYYFVSKLTQFHMNEATYETDRQAGGQTERWTDILVTTGPY